MIKNKKALLGKIISGFPVLVLIVIILGAFIILSYGAYLIKKPSPEQANQLIIPTNNLLFQTTKVEMNDGLKKSLLISDAIILNEHGKISEKNLEEAYKSLVNSENACLGIQSGSDPKFPTFGYTEFIKENKNDGGSLIKIQRDEDYNPIIPYSWLTKQTISESKGKFPLIIEVRYYLGPCPP